MRRRNRTGEGGRREERGGRGGGGQGPGALVYLVGLHKADKHREENRGRGCLGILPKILHSIIEGILQQAQPQRPATLPGTFPIPALQGNARNSWEYMEFMGIHGIHGNTWPHPPSPQTLGTQKHLGNFGVVLELLELALVALDEVLEHGVVVVHGVLALGELQAPLQLLHVQQHILQGHWGGTGVLSVPGLPGSATWEGGGAVPAAAFST